MIEADRVTQLGLTPELVHTPSESGSGQLIARCPYCRVAVWSNYASAGPLVRFVRVGTLDNPDLLPPDIHIFTASRQRWVVLPEGTPVVPITTSAMTIGLPRAWPGARPFFRASRPTRLRASRDGGPVARYSAALAARAAGPQSLVAARRADPERNKEHDRWI